MSSPSTLDELIGRLRSAQRDLELELDRLFAEQRDRFQYRLERGKVVFAQNVRRWQRQYRTGLWGYLLRAPLPFVLSAPLIYAMIVPLALLDASITLLQHVCFRIWGVPLVPRGDYLVIDRHHLAYLNPVEKLNCVYCSYANGLMAYCREVTARTEQYWCPIKHAQRTLGAHQRANRFLAYGDAEAWRTDLQRVRADWSANSPDEND